MSEQRRTPLVLGTLIAIAAGLLLASACGGGDGSGETTPETTAPVEATATAEVIVPTEEPTEPAATERIAFTSDRDGNSEIYVMNTDGSGQTNLTNNPAEDSEPAWSPDGSRIAFTSDRDGNSEIYVMDADGSGQTRLTNNPAFDSDPTWSPDGSRIAFAADLDGNGIFSIYVMNADGSNQITLNSPGDSALFGGDSSPAWSPDGSRIAFVSTVQGGVTLSIYVLSLDGSSQGGPLTDNMIPGQDPAWSPDGSRIALTRGPFGSRDIYVMNADGSGLTPLADGPDQDAAPAWSPDGAKIAFSSDRDEPNPDTCRPSCNTEIYVMNADGSGQTRLTDNAANDSSPAWSPAP